MKAIMNLNETSSNARNWGGDKEMIKALSAVVMTKGTLREVVTLRLYMGRSKNAETVLASVWVIGNGTHKGGTGNAGGWGYCKRSAAASQAFRSAGIAFDEPVDGRGMSVVREAMEATVRAMGYRGQVLIVEN